MNAIHANSLETLAIAYLKAQQRKQFWSILFRMALLLLIISCIVFFKYTSNLETLPSNYDKPHIALINISGTIQDKEPASANNVSIALNRIHRNQNVKGIVLQINSPGGSPVQADYIYSEIERIRHMHPKQPIYAVCSDMCASAAYYIAAATDKIYANQASLIGSIGVIYQGFGVQKLMQKIGVESRLQTAGSRKGILSPFLPMSAADQRAMQVNLDAIHQRFISRVKTGRGQRLSKDPNLFSGLFWSGEQAKVLGLIDGFSSTRALIRDKMHFNKVVDYTPHINFYEKIARQFSTELKEILRTTLFSFQSID